METGASNSVANANFDPPPFDEAVARLRHFVESQAGSSDLLWVFREDVTTYCHSEWIRVPVRRENANLAREYYEFGRQQGFGVTLACLCQFGGRSACYVWMPKDESEAADRLQGPCLKLQVHKGRNDANRTGTPVRSFLSWQYRCWRNRQWRDFDGLLRSQRDAAQRMASAAAT